MDIPTRACRIISRKIRHYYLQTLPISVTRLHQLTEKTKKDSHLQQLASVITTGWPGTKQDTPSSCLPYWNYCDKLSVCDYIIFKCEKTVIPNRMQHEMLDTIHSSHLGVENAKGKQEMLCYGLAWPPRSKTLLQTATSAVLTNETIQRNQW